MMWIVRLALRRPYTFVVFALLILILGVFSIASMPTDIFPNIDIPVVTVVWNYQGLSADQIANRIVTNAERGMTTTVNDIDHIESQSLVGVGLIKVFFKPHVDIAQAVAQVTAISQVMLRTLPPGTNPPFIIQYNASSVPIMQLGLSGQGLTEQQLNDLATVTIRIQLATVEGAQTPYPYGGKQREIMVDLDPAALQARGMSPADVVTAITDQNVIAPSGTVKIDKFEYQVETNSAPSLIEALNNMPIKAVNGTVVYIRDVAHVRDGNPPQTNIVRVNGRRGVIMNVLKTGTASTLDIIKSIRTILANPALKGQLPPTMRIDALTDQSIFVRAAISGVVREAIIAACLTAVMILVFLGSWRSTLIIAVSIPLSILCSLILLYALHETINIMTLGGLALAVGILVDDATVEIENINRNLEQGKEIEQAILDGAAQIATPALVSTLSICIVFVPMFLLSGVARYLFVPLAEAVVFAMLASYLLSRTVVPTMARYLLKEHDDAEVAAQAAQPQSPHPIPARPSSTALKNCATFTCGCLPCASIAPACSLSCSLSLLWCRSASLPSSARTFSRRSIPASSRFTFAPTPERALKRPPRCAITLTRPSAMSIPPDELATIIDNIGLPYSSLNLSYSTSAPGRPVGRRYPGAADPQPPPDRGVSLTGCARNWPAEYPGVTFYSVPVRHRHPDSEFRTVVAHRHPDRRPGPLCQSRPGRENAQRSSLRARRGGRAHPAAVQLSQLHGERGPHARGSGGTDAGQRGAKPAGDAERQLSNQPQFLSRSAQRRFLQHRHSGSAVPVDIAGRAEEPAGYRRRNHPGAGQRGVDAGAGSRGLCGARRCNHYGAGSGEKPVEVLGNLANIVPGAEQGHGQPLRHSAGDRHLHQR